MQDCLMKVGNHTVTTVYTEKQMWSDKQDLLCCTLLCQKWFSLYLYVKHPVSYSSAGVKIHSSPPTL